MQPLPIVSLSEALEKAVVDEHVGISLAMLAEADGFALYATAIPPGRQLKAHYHCEGAEFYQVVSGKGRVFLQPQPAGDISQHLLKAGDVFAIPPLVAHQLQNTAEVPLVMIFACSVQHLGEDRELLHSDLARNREAE